MKIQELGEEYFSSNDDGLIIAEVQGTIHLNDWGEGSSRGIFCVRRYGDQVP